MHMIALYFMHGDATVPSVTPKRRTDVGTIHMIAGRY